MAARKVNRAPRPPREAALAIVARQGFVTSGDVSAQTGLSRQAVHRHLRRMVEAGELVPQGAGRTARYVRERRQLRLRRAREGLDEANLYLEVEASLPLLGGLPTPATRIVHYVFTEIVNNAVDHSGGGWVDVEVALEPGRVVVEVTDDGIGAFENVRASLGLASQVEAVLELSKGKTTTDPAHHTGQGLFFSSKAVARFEIESGALRWIVDNRRSDEAIGATPARRGTRVRFEVDRDSKRELREIFDEYTTDHEFDRTRTVVRLFQYGTEFVSRSEAKRLLHGLERFREAVLDFAGVEAIGQGFADEVFRVWSRAHAGTRLLPLNMVEPVGFMVRRALVAEPPARG